MGWSSAPCGVGKSIIFLGLFNYIRVRHVIVVLPLLQLIKQLAVKWKPLSTHWDYKTIVLCSHRDILPPSLCVLSRTDPKQAADAYRSSVGPTDNVLVFCTYKSAGRIAAFVQHAGFGQFDVGVLDEAHDLAPPPAGVSLSDYDKEAAFALSFPCKTRFFVTATPPDVAKRGAEYRG